MVRTTTGARAPRRWVAAAVATAATVSVAGLGAPPAVSAASDQCPEAFPVARLAEGQPVRGLTVSQGTTPDAFTGTVLGVLDNGIMPGIDLILVDLTSPEVDRVGIWSGMSGSPVYAADGRLLGAVSYGFSGGSPAAARAATDVALPTRMATRLVRSGDATAAEVESGLSQLRLPFGIAGLGSQRRFDAVVEHLDLQGVRMVRAGTAATDVAPAPLEAGGNLAATVAYGDITAGAVGTVTAVCGTEVIGFGHPMDWTGPTSMAMHTADVVHVQEDDVFGGFKMANIGGPVGTVDQDRMPGIAGVLGAAPDAGQVTSTVASGTRARTGSTQVYRPELMPSLAFAHLLTTMDRVFDGIGKGSGTMAWTVAGTREDGTGFELSRSDVYASDFDLTFEAAWDVVMALETLENNGAEDVTLDTVDADATLTRDFDRYLLRRVEVRRSGEWVRVNPDRTLRLKAGTTRLLRVHLTSPVSGARTLITELAVPRRALGMFGSLEVFGGNSGFFGEEEFFEEGLVYGDEDEQTFDEVLDDLAGAPLNSDVVAKLVFYDERGAEFKRRESRASTGLVVDGAVAVTVRATRR
jgi:hypothetical protein